MQWDYKLIIVYQPWNDGMKPACAIIWPIQNGIVVTA